MELEPLKSISAMIPAIIRNTDTQRAFSLFGDIKAGCPWLPEAFCLFNTPGLTAHQKRSMNMAIFQDDSNINDNESNLLADCHARFGTLGFSFPTWRFLTQGFSGASVIEEYGFKRIERPTDVQDPGLPKSNPARDLYGIGFLKKTHYWTIEYRRAYLLCTCHIPGREVSVIIRNSSYFFGRDRLPHAVYINWDTSIESFNEEASFVPWQNLFRTHGSISLADKINRIHDALAHFLSEDLKLMQWMFTPAGIPSLEQLLEKFLLQQKSGAPFYVATIADTQPPWFPESAMAANDDLLRQLKMRKVPQVIEAEIAVGRKPVLLSGEKGDFPTPPKWDL